MFDKPAFSHSIMAGLSVLARLSCQTIIVMTSLIEKNIHCPYCGEHIDILIDNSVVQQSYIEDCQVCCRPIIVNVSCHDDGEIIVTVAHENE